MTEYRIVKCSRCGQEIQIPRVLDHIRCPNCDILLIDYREGIDALFP